MSKRIKIVSSLKPANYAVEGIGWGLLLLTFVLAIYGFVVLPETVPTHFNFKGQPDAYGSKISLLFVPIISLILTVGMTWLNCYPEIFNYPVKITEENAEKQYKNAQTAIRWLKVAVNMIFSLITWAIFVSANLSVSTQLAWLLPIIVFLPLLVMIFFIRNAVKSNK
jgi:uncharacterized membrane protein